MAGPMLASSNLGEARADVIGIFLANEGLFERVGQLRSSDRHSAYRRTQVYTVRLYVNDLEGNFPPSIRRTGRVPPMASLWPTFSVATFEQGEHGPFQGLFGWRRCISSRTRRWATLSCSLLGTR